ncbi:peptidase M24, structural domain-containing protein [Limtongia smithiae]|uniref:peptidase M24, structural domain-containing protein n=1 Tax=Limtongia smithiae TaxID=1125753 RepID=UPI0034CE625F
MTIDTKYPAKQHALSVKNHMGGGLFPAPIILLASPRTTLWPFCDQAQPFRQNRNFYYMSGCDLPDCYLTYDTGKDKLVLYLPPIDKDDVVWSGMPMSIEEAKAACDVDDVRYSDALKADLTREAVNGQTICTVEALLEVSAHAAILGDTLSQCGSFKNPQLMDALEEARAFKDDYEVALMRCASAISDNAHYKVMSTMKFHTNETHIHAEFVYHSIRAGSKNQSYDPICCSGRTCSTLHYVRNADDITGGKQLILIDAGAEWKNYASDVTRTFPISGEWTTEALAIYTLVLKMQTACMQRVAPEVLWDELHLLAHEILIAGFLELGIFKDGTAEEILKSRISAAFYPHGLGHMLGMDTHDTAGHANYSDPDPIFRYLRIRRELKAGMVVTVEPGIYFNPFLLDLFMRGEEGTGDGAKFVDKMVLEKYWDVGGVRIEDDVLVTPTGFENFTKIAKDPAEISAIIKGAKSE